MQNDKETYEFIKSMDFMRIGQAVSHGKWQSAHMALQRLMQKATECDCRDFDRQFAGLKYAIQRKDIGEARQILSLIVNKRAQFWNAFSESSKNT